MWARPLGSFFNSGGMMKSKTVVMCSRQSIPSATASRVAQRSHAVSEKERQDFVAGDMGEVEPVHQVHVRVDQSGDEVLAVAVNELRIGRRSQFRAADSANAVTDDDDGALGQHLAGAR